MTNPTQRKLQWSVLAMLVVFAISIYSCRKDNDEECCDPTNPECPNYEPCYGIDEPTANFTMGEVYLVSNEGWFTAPNDSVFISEIEFAALYDDEDVQHTWYLGSEVINEASFTRTHGLERPAIVEVSHVIEYPTDEYCYSSFSGRDSVSRTYTLVEHYNDLAVFGRFRGAFEASTDSFDFEFKYVYPDNSPVAIPQNFELDPIKVGLNFNNQIDSMEIILGGAGNLGIFAGDGVNTPDGTMTFEEGAIPPKARLEYEFQGQQFVVNARKLD